MPKNAYTNDCLITYKVSKLMSPICPTFSYLIAEFWTPHSSLKYKEKGIIAIGQRVTGRCSFEGFIYIYRVTDTFVAKL